MTKLYVILCVIVLTVLMTLGAIWQHGRYVALQEKFEAIVEANKALAEASEKQEAKLQASEDAIKQISVAVRQSTQQTQADIKSLSTITKQGNENERAIMSASLPPSIDRLLDNAYKSRSEAGANP